MSNRVPIAAFSLFLALVVGVLTGCRPSDGALSPAAEATINFLEQENARLVSEVARLQTAADFSVGGAESDLLSEMLAQQATPSDAAQSPLAASADAASGSEPAPPTTPIVVPTPLPPPTPLPTFEAQTFADGPPAERFAAAIPFDTSWSSDEARQQALGWSLEAEPSAVSVVTQPFERGLMLWRSDTGQIYALWEQEGERAWRAFEDTFEEGEAETDPALAAPGGLQQPERGFGKLWRQNPTLRDALGWAQVRENKGEALVQAFEHGLMLYVDGRIYAIGQTPAGAPVWFLE